MTLSQKSQEKHPCGGVMLDSLISPIHLFGPCGPKLPYYALAGVYPVELSVYICRCTLVRQRLILLPHLAPRRGVLYLRPLEIPFPLMAIGVITSCSRCTAVEPIFTVAGIAPSLAAGKWAFREIRFDWVTPATGSDLAPSGDSGLSCPALVIKPCFGGLYDSNIGRCVLVD